MKAAQGVEHRVTNLCEKARTRMISGHQEQYKSNSFLWLFPRVMYGCQSSKAVQTYDRVKHLVLGGVNLRILYPVRTS